MLTYNCTHHTLYNISQIIRSGNEDRSLLCVGCADLVDPSEDEWSRSTLLVSGDPQY
jgi:hypothetical protein